MFVVDRAVDDRVMEGSTMDVRDLVARAAAATRVVLEGVRTDQLESPTPCPEMVVRDLVGHLFEVVLWLGDIGSGRPAATVPAVGTDPAVVVADYDTALATTLDIWRAEGAMDRKYAAPWGQSSAEQLLHFFLLELLVHGWDLAAATGQQLPADDDLVGHAHHWAVTTVDKTSRIPGVYGAEVVVSPKAPLIERLAGFLGRSPAWPAGTR